MKTKVFKITFICLAGVLISLACIFLFAQLPNQKKNGFTRSWLNGSATLLHSQSTNFPISKISGATENYLFFSGEDPRWILVTDTTLTTRDTLLFKIKATPQLVSAINIFVDSPKVYMHAGNISYLISGKVHNSDLDTLRLHTPLFSRAVQISQNLMIIRGMDSSQKRQVFKKIDCNTGQVLQEATIIEDQKDAGFSTDGFLQYDSTTKRILYVQMYQNRFFCLDTALQLMYTGKTIDTCKTNGVDIKPVKQKDGTIKLMPSSARQIINEGAYANRGYLYIISGLKADNESFSNFTANSVIDLYEIIGGKYLGSFYIPTRKGKKINTMLVQNRLLVVLYEGGHSATFLLNIPPIAPTIAFLHS